MRQKKGASSHQILVANGGYVHSTGSCYYWTDGANTEEQFQFYVEVALGADWYPSLALATTATCLSLLAFFYVTSYCCSAQVQGVRWFVGLFMGVVIVIFQGLSFLVHRSSWCDNEGCQISRGGAFSATAAACYLLCGLSFFFMSSYPGAKALAAMIGDEEAPIAARTREREDEPPEEDPFSDELDDEPKEAEEPREGENRESAPENEEKEECAEEEVTTAEVVGKGDEFNDGETHAAEDAGGAKNASGTAEGGKIEEAAAAEHALAEENDAKARNESEGAEEVAQVDDLSDGETDAAEDAGGAKQALDTVAGGES